MKKRPLANFDWRKYISLNNTTLNEYLYDYGDDFLYQTLALLIDAHKNSLPSIVLIEFTINDIVAVVEKKDYMLALHRLLHLCERMEKYEICAEIVNYEKTIKPKRKSLTKKSHKITTIN